MRRTYINIAAFAALSTVLIAWSFLNYLPLGLLEDPRVVTAEFDQSPGLRAGYEVTYLGHSVGRIESVSLVPGTSEVRMAIDDDADLPAELTAAARRRSAIGEPYVDLAPLPGASVEDGPRLADGDRIPAERTTSPIEYGELFRSLDQLIDQVDGGALATVLREAARAVDGRGDDIRRIIVASDELSRSAAANGDELESLITDLGTVAGVLADNRDALGSSIGSLRDLAATLGASRDSIEQLLDTAPPAFALLDRIVAASDSALLCTVDGLSVLQVALDDEALRSTEALLARSAAFADVVRLVRDPDDGVFNLLVTVNSGEPTVVQYDRPEPVPTAPATPACPTHGFEVVDAPATVAADPGAGGRRPPSDPPGIVAGDRGPAAGADQASGASDARAADPALVRLARAGLPWLALLCLALAAAWLIRSRLRRSDL